MKSLFFKLSKLINTNGKKAYFYGIFYSFFCNNLKLKRDAVLIESMMGEELTGNSLALMKHIIKNNKYKVYAVADRGYRSIKHDNLFYVSKDSIYYLYLLATSKYLINDSTFPIYFSKRESQKYLNTWHGTPLKTLGRNFKKDSFKSINNATRNFMHSDFLLAPNEHTRKIFLRDYMLSSIFGGEIFVDGYPRNDVFLEKKKKNSESKNCNIVYMPTWRGLLSDSVSSSKKFINDLYELFDYLDEKLCGDIKLWVNLHAMISVEIDLSRYKNIELISKDVNIYEFLSTSDGLITDYSSILFDFSLSKKPIIIYAPDISIYSRERGVYMDLDALPFPIFLVKNELVECINKLKDKSYCEDLVDLNYLRFIEKYCSFDDGFSTERVCDKFFNNDILLKSQKQEKLKILIYVGPLLKNGIVSSFKNLISLIDNSKYDVTILAETKDELESAQNYYSSLPFEIKYIPLYFRMYCSLLDFVRFSFMYITKYEITNKSKFLVRIFKNEYRRIFGSSKFDVFVNYNGYSWKAALLSLGMPCPSIIYVHNEMDREIKANKIADTRFLKISYQQASKIAVVRKGIEENYCNNYYDYRNKVQYVPNPLLNNVIEKTFDPLHFAFNNGESDPVYIKVKNALLLNDVVRFVNIGRFSKEKGQIRLIRAFEEFHKKNPKSQLFIIGGYGQMEQEIVDIVDNSQFSDAIFVIRGSTNPFPLIKHMNFFFLSSFYEGLPVVFFEMLQLGIPIISTDIAGPSDFLNQGYGLVVENSIQGLIHGMEKAIKNEIPSKDFDFEGHNKYALDQFYSAINSVIEKS